jgi:TP901 family phage tail tape measure protein
LAALNRIQSKSTLSLNTRNFTQPLGKITGLANEFQKSLEASNARVIAFGASAGIIYNVQKAFSALVSSTIEVEKSLTDINIVLNTSSSGIRQFGDQLFNVAKQTGSSFKDVAAAATEFSRQGLGLEETLRRTRDALVLTRLSGLDVVSSTEALTSAVNSFTKEALTTTEVVNKLAAVDARFAVSSRDLSEAIQRVGSSASEAGVSFDELLGIVTSVQQTTARGGAVIGNALKTIFTRIERPQVINDLRDFGVTVTDLSGNALPAIKVLENLSQSFQNLSPVVKSQVAELVGGVYQINILKASLADLSKENSVFAGATSASSRAVDEAIVKNKALNESLSALLSQTTANVTQFAAKVGSVSVAPGIRKVLGYINEELSSINEKDSESVGAKIGTGILSGITNFITGPGLIIGASILGKLFSNFGKFTGDAAKNLLGLNTIAQQQAVVQGEVGQILSRNPQLIAGIIAGSKTRLQVEKEIKQILIEQSALSQQIAQSSSLIGRSLITGGLGVSRSGTVTGRAGGYIPMRDRVAEVSSAAKGGYVAGNVVNAPASVGGVMNTAETVKYVPGFSQPFILPPAGSKAASSLASRSMNQTGVNPYMAKGYVPNFAPTIGQWYKTKRDEGLLKSVTLNPDGTLSGFNNASLNSASTAGVPIEEIRRASKNPTWLPKQAALEREVGRQVAQLPAYMAKAEMLTLESPNQSGQIIERGRGVGNVPIAFKVANLSKEALQRNKTDLRSKADNYANELLNDFANDLPGGQKSTPELRTKYLSAVQNPAAQFAGKIFEAAINLSRDYTREGKGGGDFDVRGGANINKVRELFPGFTSNLGDYKLQSDDDSQASFVKKILSEFPGDIKIFEDEARAKASSVDVTAEAAKLKASGEKVANIVKRIAPGGKKAFGFIPNFAPKPFNFRFSNLGEKTAQISPKLRDWLADKYFDPEMASAETLRRLASLNRDSGGFFSTLEYPDARSGIAVRGQQGFISRQNRGARAGAFLNALRARLPDFIPGSLPNLASGFVPNFNPIQEAVAREMSAGYSSSQVKLGQNSQLKTSFNPNGLGVYNTTEGSLGSGISLAKKAGINPQTKGMAEGFIPNFADEFDISMVTLSLIAFGSQLKSLVKDFKDVGSSSKELVKANTASYSAASTEIKKIKGEARKAFGGSVNTGAGGALELTNITRGLTSKGKTIKATDTKSFELYESLKTRLSGQLQEQQSLKRSSQIAEAGYLNPLSLRSGGKLNTLVRTAGTGAGLAAAGALNIAEQFVPESNKKTKAAFSGAADVAQYAGLGAAFGPVGAAAGALVGVGIAAKKIVDSKAEQAIFDISANLDRVKESSSKFSGASQTYATSLESLQNALNDPKTQPQALLKFQTSITDSLASIPNEFRGKVLAAGTDIGKVADAIARVNKEMSDAQQSLERQLAITKLVNDKTGIIAGSNLKKADSDQLNRLFVQSIDPQKVLSGFKGGAGEFGSFISNLKGQSIKTDKILEYGANPNFVGSSAPKFVERTNVDQLGLKQIRSQLESKGIFGPELAAKFEEVSKNISVENVKSLFDAIDKFGKGIFSSKEAAGNLLAVQKQNIETAKKNADILKDLTQRYENLNLSLSSQIEAEKNRSSTLRELNKIQAEGSVQLASARTKGALSLASPFMTEAGKTAAESSLALTDLQNKQNSEVRGALDKGLSSFTDIITKKAEDIRSKALPAVTDLSKSPEDITKELNVFNKNIQGISPLIASSLKELSAGGNIEVVKNKLIQGVSATGLFKKPEAELIAGELQNTFEGVLNELIKITEQGEYDKAIQKVNSDYQRRSVALSEKLSLAGGAAALGSTGQVGVSDLFDKLTELTSTLGQNVRVGNPTETGSGLFKLLDTISNQYGIRGGGVGAELAPLQNASITARAEQLKKESERARALTNISLIGQTGSGIQSGGALEKAFDNFNENAMSVAIDQVTSQLKLDNIGTYFDLLAQESKYANELAKTQTEILAKQAPDITKAFYDISKAEVGSKITELNRSLSEALKQIVDTQNTAETNKEIRNLLPIASVEGREKALSTIKNAIKQNPSIALDQQSSELNPFISNLEVLAADLNIPFENLKSIISKLNKLSESTPISIPKNNGSFSPFGPYKETYKFPPEQASFYNANISSRNTIIPVKPQSLIDAEIELQKTQENIQLEKNKKLEEINRIYGDGNKELAAQMYLEMQIADERAKVTERLNKTKEETKRLYGSAYGDTFFKEEKAARMNSQIEDNARLGKVDVGGITEKNTTYNRADFAKDTGQLIDTFQTDFKSGIGSAFGEAIKGTKTLKDAFRDMFQGILNRMLDKSLEMGVDALFAFGKAATTGRKDGGPIKGYNSGGMVTGGSGMKDDVPAMMSGGEYVIKKSSVDKYGSDYLRNLNGGIIPRYATGGFSVGPLQNEFLYDNPDRPTSGEFAVDSRLSAMALTDDNNSQNKLRQDRYEKLDQYLQDRAQYERDKKQSLKNYKNQVNSTFYSGLTAAAVQIGAAGLTAGAESLRGSASTSAGRGLEPGGNLSQSQLNEQYAKNLRAGGGYIAKFAGGGSTGQDNIPALLMGGEYVMNKKAVDMYGKDFMGQLNSGSLPKYASGGMVGTSYSGQSNTDQSSSMDELVTALNTLNDNLSKDSGITQSESGRSSLAGATQESGMSVVNNISINMSQGGEVTSEANSSTQKGASNSKNDQNSMQNNGKLAELLRSKVVEVLVEQKRPGGLLYASR